MAPVWPTLVGTAAAAAVTVLLGQPAAASSIQERRIVDGCDVGGGGNDIYAITSHYRRDKNRIDVTLQLCAEAKPGTTYLLHIDHSAPLVEQAKACADPTDALLARGPKGHQGAGRSEVTGNLVRFFVPLGKLGVGSPKNAPIVLLWAESKAGGVVDRAPNRESGDKCDQPQVRSETLVQTRAVNGNLIWIMPAPTNAFFPDGIDDANVICAQGGQNAGLSGSFVAWFSAQGADPTQQIPLTTPPLYTADGTQIAQSVADLANCTKGSGNACLLAPIDKEVNGVPVKAGTATWTGTLPNGTASGSPNCDDWLTASPGASGNGGTVSAVDSGWTTGNVGKCNALRGLICLQVTN